MMLSGYGGVGAPREEREGREGGNGTMEPLPEAEDSLFVNGDGSPGFLVFHVEW
jgi:hypothetical protein